MTERVSRLEGIAEDTRHRLDDLSRGQTALDAKIDILRAESHAENQATNDKIDRQGETIRAEHRADYLALDAKIDALRSEVNRLRTDMYRQTFLLLGGIAALMALFRFLG